LIAAAAARWRPGRRARGFFGLAAGQAHLRRGLPGDRVELLHREIHEIAAPGGNVATSAANAGSFRVLILPSFVCGRPTPILEG
jgi:hypothetical protein